MSALELTGGERVIRCLIGEQIDRVPFGISLGWHPWGEALTRWRKETGDPNLDYGAVLGFDRYFSHPAAHLGMLPAFEPKMIADEGETYVHQDDKGIIKRDRKGGGSMPQFLKHPVESWDDWEKIKAERLVIGDPARIKEDWETYRARLKETGEVVQIGTFPYGVFGTPRDLMGAEEVLISYHTQPDLVKDMMQHLTSLWLSVWEMVAAEVQIDHIHIWEDMSGKQGSLISPAMIREFMMPQYDRVADFASAHNVRVFSVDSDGDCSELVPIMMDHGVNMFFPFEVQAGNDIREYRRKYPTLGILCGLDKRALARGKKEIDAEVEKAREMVKLGRYIPAFDHLIPPDVPWENFRYAAEEIRKVCFGVRS